MALGHPPQALAELVAYRRVAPVPLPDDTIDFGLRGAPNLEALSLAAPDLILSASNYAFAEPQLARIAPVFSRPLYVAGESPLPKVTDLLPDLAKALGTPDAAAPVIAAAQAEFAALAARITGPRPCLLLEIGDARHVRTFGADSLFGGALVALDLANAWTEGKRFAFYAPVPIERLAAFEDVRIVMVGEIPPQAQRALDRGALWQSLAPVRRGDVHRLPGMNAFGGLPSALRFARELVAALERAA